MICVIYTIRKWVTVLMRYDSDSGMWEQADYFAVNASYSDGYAVFSVSISGN